MKGYFSRLAERTGLGFASPAARSASGGGGLAQSPEFARERASTPALLHTEEITFTSQPQADASATPTQNAAEEFREALHEDNFVYQQRDDERLAASGIELQARSSTVSAAEGRESETRRRRAGSVDHLQSFPQETDMRFAASAPQRRTSREPESSEPADSIGESPRRTNAAEASPFADGDARTMREPQRREATPGAFDDFTSPLDAEEIGGMSRAEIYQNYLREVRKWVAEDAPASLDEEASKEDSRVAAATLAEDALGYVREREPATQDFNLSIGTISIVVEETPPQTVMQATPPARAERAPAPRAARSSGRNYLRFK